MSGRWTGEAPLRLGAAALALCLAGPWVGCGLTETAKQQERETERPPNVVLVLADTLRADHMGLYGYERDTTPELSRLAEQGVVFEQARSQASCTFPSANSILTSRHIHDFLGRSDDDAESDGGRMGIPPTVPSVATLFRDAGYATAAVSASPIVRVTPSQFNPGGGFGQGFDRFDERCLWRDADCVLRRAKTMMEGVREPYFLYLHFMDPHGPYEPPRTHFSTPYAGDRPWVEEGKIHPMVEARHSGGDATWTDADLRHLVDLYDDEIRYLDSRLAPFLDPLLADGETVVALISDHGESFFDHGPETDAVGHCRSAWDSEIRVPFVLFGPNLEPRSVPLRTSALHLVPTLLDLAGLDPPTGLDGRSLAPLVRRRGDESYDAAAFQAAEPPSLAQAGRWRSFVWNGYKLTMHLGVDETAPSFQLFDLAADPRERVDLAARDPDLTRQLKDRMKQYVLEVRGDKPAPEADAELDDAIEQLRALGYLE